jgi:hypothetical protein
MRRRTLSDASFEAQHGQLRVRDLRLERCTFDNCAAHGGLAERVDLIDCATWACSLRDVVPGDCSVTNLRTSIESGGKRTPLFLWGVMTERVTLAGKIGSIIWNPPHGASIDFVPAMRFYDAVDDWAVDVSEARFTSVPSLRFGPPGWLVCGDPATQPLVSRRAAETASPCLVLPAISACGGSFSRTWCAGPGQMRSSLSQRSVRQGQHARTTCGGLSGSEMRVPLRTITSVGDEQICRSVRVGT